jgi:xanthine/CO dehydrogenase XdhC/CoxF family maturation factor
MPRCPWDSPALPDGWAPDAWTAVAVLFHDHEWERTLVPWAMGTGAFYVGAQGGAKTRANRLELWDRWALGRMIWRGCIPPSA